MITQNMIDEAVDRFREQLEDKLIKNKQEEVMSPHQFHKQQIEMKTCNIPELAVLLGVSKSKARELVRIDGFPVMKLGREYRIVIGQLDKWLEENIGETF